MFRFLRKLVEVNGFGAIARRVQIDLAGYQRHLTPRRMANLFLGIWQMQTKQNVLSAYPYRLYVEPTNSCNLRCPYCFGWQGRSKRPLGFMDLQTFKNLVDDVGEYVLWMDLYNRGEPLLNRNIFEMISYCSSRNVATRMSSNLNLLDDSGAERMVQNGLDYLVVAMDGANQDTYARYRVRGDLRVVVENVRRVVYWKHKLGSLTPRITLRVLLTRYNEHELPDIRRIASELSVDNLLFFPMFVDAAKKENIEEWLPRDENKSWYDYSEGSNSLSTTKRIICPELWRRGVVNWDGSVYPCCFVDTGQAYGNVREQSFRSLWNGPSFVKSRQALIGGDTTAGTICANCQGSLKRG